MPSPPTSKHRSPLKVLKKKTDLAGIPEPVRHIVQSVLFKSNTLFMLLTFQLIYQGEGEHDKTFETS